MRAIGHLMRIKERHTGQRGTVVRVVGWYQPDKRIPPWPICISDNLPGRLVMNPEWLVPAPRAKTRRVMIDTD
jgi:hypothetical protein